MRSGWDMAGMAIPSSSFILFSLKTLLLSLAGLLDGCMGSPLFFWVNRLRSMGSIFSWCLEYSVAETTEYRRKTEQYRTYRADFILIKW